MQEQLEVPWSVLYHGCSYLASWPWLLMICPAIFGAQHLSISLNFILTHRTQLSCRSSNSWPIKTIPLHGRTCAVPLAESFQDLFKLGGLIDGTGRDLKHALQSGNFHEKKCMISPQSFNDGLGCIALELDTPIFRTTNPVLSKMQTMTISSHKIILQRHHEKCTGLSCQ